MTALRDEPAIDRVAVIPYVMLRVLMRALVGRERRKQFLLKIDSIQLLMLRRTGILIMLGGYEPKVSRRLVHFRAENLCGRRSQRRSILQTSFS